MLMPAAVLVLLILGSIAVDSAVALLGQRELNSYTTEAADNAAASAVVPATFYRQDRIDIDPVRAQQIADELAAGIGSGVRDVQVTVTVNGADVRVTASGTVEGVFARAIPGMRHTWHVRASSTATARRVTPG